jgi:hypothetical protein
MWMELTTMHAPDYFGEAAMLGRGIRHAAAIADSAVEVLVLLKLDFDLKIDAETRDILNVLVSQYPKDATFIKYVFLYPESRNCNSCFVASNIALQLVRCPKTMRQWAYLGPLKPEPCMNFLRICNVCRKREKRLKMQMG